MGGAPAPLDAAWFPNRLHAYVWRNWALVPHDRLARVIGATEDQIGRVALRMGLEPARGLTDAQLRRAHLTIIRRNWHLLPYDQLLALLDWAAERLAYTLREDDFFFVKVGNLKPKCEPLRWSEPTAEESARADEIAAIVRAHFPDGRLEGDQPLFAFIDALRAPVPPGASVRAEPRTDAIPASKDPLRIGYSYFALCGDPLIDRDLDPYPDGLLRRLALVGATAVWLHIELAHLAALPWNPDARIDQRREALRDLVVRSARHGLRVFLYLNEPRALPAKSTVFEHNPAWRGIEEQGYHAVCTSAPDVRAAIRDGIADLCRAVPELGGFFSITASENLTSCWSHGRGDTCPRCASRGPAEVIAEVSRTFAEGVALAGGRQRYVAWDWGWHDDWALDVIRRLPDSAQLMSVSEWSLPIERGGVKTEVGEYSISAIGPGPRAKRHWEAAQARGLRVAAKVQCGNTWEMSAVPYLPVLENVTRHAAALRELGVRDLLLGWTTGSHPSPNIDAMREIIEGGSIESLAERRHGPSAAPHVVRFWRACSEAFREFPYHIGCVYSAPLQMGPANPLWERPTGYRACMVGIPYDDLAAWRAVYPPDVFASQLEKVATGFETALAAFRDAVTEPTHAIVEEQAFAEAAAIHFASVANQSRAVVARDAGDSAALASRCDAEAKLAVRLHALQSRESRVGFEASNQYYYTPHDLVEKVVNCRRLEALARGSGTSK
ncbi:MAG: hypothetical protein FJ297_08960 [Planctomycetes bacterium]|nr:hypothetical protein [Planctomycetota bacterium]